MNIPTNLPTPCHIIDLDKLTHNLDNPISQMRQKTGCKILLAIKGFSADTILPYMREGLDGISASGAFEARLGKETVQKYVCTYSPAYQECNIKDVVAYSDAVVFNSVRQFSVFHPLAIQSGCSCGIRINPEYSELASDFGPNPCQPQSRLGVKLQDMPPLSMFDKNKIEGVHLHTMCEQEADALERTIDVLEESFAPYLRRVRWVNLGGGQMYAQQNYDIDRAAACINRLKSKYDVDIVLEPCEGIMAGVGYFAASVVDIVHNEGNVAVLDASGICHMPDAVYRGWRHDIVNADEVGRYPHVYRITGPSCYAGDIWGDYSFPSPLFPGAVLLFKDTAAYTMVKNSTFNGIPMPALATYSLREGVQVKKTFDYEAFLRCQ